MVERERSRSVDALLPARPSHREVQNIRLGTTRWGGHHGSISALVRKHSCTTSTILRPNRRNPHFCHLSIAAARKCERVDVLDGHGVMVSRHSWAGWTSKRSGSRLPFSSGASIDVACRRQRFPGAKGLARTPGVRGCANSRRRTLCGVPAPFRKLLSRRPSMGVCIAPETANQARQVSLGYFR